MLATGLLYVELLCIGMGLEFLFKDIYFFTYGLLYFFKWVFMSFLKPYIIFMRWEFRPESYFSDMFVYPGPAVVGEQDSDLSK